MYVVNNNFCVLRHLFALEFKLRFMFRFQLVGPHTRDSLVNVYYLQEKVSILQAELRVSLNLLNLDQKVSL